MYIKDLATGKKEMIFDAAHSKPSIPKSRPLEEQGPRESQKLWHSTTDAIKRADQKVATDEKSRIEDEQRKEAADRGGDENWSPKLFTARPSGDEENLDWIIPYDAVDTKAPAEKQIEQILALAPILPGQKSSAPAPQKAPQAQQAPQGQAPAVQQPGADLIDFGQNDGAATHPPAAATASASGGAAASMQQPLQPSASQPSSSLPRGAVKRMDTDTDGSEDVFVDAES